MVLDMISDGMNVKCIPTVEKNIVRYALPGSFKLQVEAAQCLMGGFSPSSYAYASSIGSKSLHSNFSQSLKYIFLKYGDLIVSAISPYQRLTFNYLLEKKQNTATRLDRMKIYIEAESITQWPLTSSNSIVSLIVLADSIITIDVFVSLISNEYWENSDHHEG
uniref:Uncharacterized protein n=1 Tax=Solanum lycopersicum TaxID=4081 RepID=A0A3Q7FCD4_SOLLC